MNALVVMEEGTGALRNGDIANQKVAVEIVEWEGRVGTQRVMKCRLG